MLLAALVCVILAGCSRKSEPDKYSLSGVWVMTHAEYPVLELSEDFPDADGETLCRIYEGDSIFYECWIRTMKPGQPQNVMTASDVIIVPKSKCVCTLIQKDGAGNPLYLEDGSVLPVRFLSNTSMTIQKVGIVFSWTLAKEMKQERIAEIKEIIANNLSSAGEMRQFVLPTTERQLEAANSQLKTTAHTLSYIIIILVLVVLLIVYVAINVFRKKQRVEQQLRQMSEERELRPQPVRQAMAEVEEDFLHSEFYLSLRRRIAAGEMLREEDWKEMEQRMKSVWPAFSNRLFDLCHLSELEYRVCLLIKLRVSPSEMAALLSKDTSTISTVRSRLYQKVFQRKGSSKAWDSFILSM